MVVMSKVRVTFELDLETGDYEVAYNNVSRPGSSIDFTRCMAMLRRVFFDHTDQVVERQDGE